MDRFWKVMHSLQERKYMSLSWNCLQNSKQHHHHHDKNDVARQTELFLESPSRLLSYPYSLLDFLSFALLSYWVYENPVKITAVISEVTQQVQVYNNNDVDRSLVCKVELNNEDTSRSTSEWLFSQCFLCLNNISRVKTTWHKTNCLTYLLLRHSFRNLFSFWQRRRCHAIFLRQRRP